jgi:hypothetical protein
MTTGKEREGVRWMGAIFWIMGLGNLGNGLWMLLAPENWFQYLPAGVPDTGPFNHHFVQDIGSAFTTIGVLFIVSARRALERRGVVLAAALFYGLHAFVHVTDVHEGRLHADHLAHRRPQCCVRHPPGASPHRRRPAHHLGYDPVAVRSRLIGRPGGHGNL